MGSQLAVLAAVQLIALATASEAAADNKKSIARQLFELGIDEYKNKQYTEAAASLSKSHALDPQPDALYALAQAERLGGNCKDALVHYEQLAGTSKDERIVKAVTANIELCKQIEAGKEPVVDPKLDAQEIERNDAPVIQYRTVVRTESKSDGLVIASFAGGGILLGGSVALFLVARAARSDADRAQTLDEYNDLYDRSTNLKIASYAAAGVGAGLVTYAVYRLVRGGKAQPQEREVAIVPIDGGSMLSFGGRW